MKMPKSTVTLGATFLSAAIFMLAGLSKLVDPGTSEARFIAWGFPAWMSTVIGLIEAVGGAALMVPSLTGLAAMLLGAEMLGAMATHLRAAEYGMAWVPILLFSAMAYISYDKRRDMLELMDKVLDFMHIPHRTHHI